MRAVTWLPGIVKDLLRARRAATSVELALVGPCLILVILMIIENGLMLLAQAALDNATDLAARQIQIGNITDVGTFRSAMCSYTSSTFFNCANLQFNVASSSSTPVQPLVPNANGTFSSASFSTGNGSDYVTVQVAYNRTYVSPWLITLGTGWVLLSTTAIQNEPFS